LATAAGPFEENHLNQIGFMDIFGALVFLDRTARIHPNRTSSKLVDGGRI
jgi:hypothetical protein